MDEASASVRVFIKNELGLHAKPAMAFQALAARFDCEVSVQRTDNAAAANGKSLMSLLTLMLTAGTEIEIRTTGPGAEDAATKLADLVRSGFCED